MQQTKIILTQVTAMLLMAFIGYIARKTNFLPEKTGDYLSKIVIKITAPALILSTFTAYEFDAQTLFNGFQIWAFAVFFMLFSLIIGTVVGRLLKLNVASANVFRVHIMAGNVGYLALPIFKAVFDEKTVVLAAFYIVAYDMMMWTIGVNMLNRHRHKTLTTREILRNFVNVNSICCGIGLVFALVNFQQYIKLSEPASFAFNIFHSALSSIGNCTLPLVMMFTGMLMAENSSGGLLGILKKPVTMAVCLLKLIVVPAVGLGIMLLLGDFVEPHVRTIIAMQLAMPCGALVVAYAAEIKSDVMQASDNMIYSTVLCLFTLPLFMVLLNYI